MSNQKKQEIAASKAAKKDLKKAGLMFLSSAFLMLWN